MLTAPRLTAALALLMGSLAVASLTPLDVDKRQSATCAAVHLFVARGTTEPPGDGLIGSLAQLVLGANPGATEESIDYPATSDPIYLPSVTIGIEAVTEQVTSYVSACPNSTLVLMGYSQGAQIILDALCGSGSPELGGTGEPTIILEQGANIAAVVVYGDPSRVNGESWNLGTATRNGRYPRPAGACNAWAERIHSYCNSGDPFCASGANFLVHLSYFPIFNTQASQWVNQQIQSQ